MAWDRNSYYTPSGPINRVEPAGTNIVSETFPNPASYVSAMPRVKSVVTNRYYNPPLVATISPAGP